jgi:hypothetical protein
MILHTQQEMRSEHVSVTGTVKFFNETKGYLFGAVGIGLQLPASALLQTEQGLAWDVAADTTMAGGHYVPLVGRQADGLHVVSWGAIQRMTEAFLTQYCDEAVAYVSQECLLDQKSPEGFAYDDLISDLAALA